ncbi:unnamed protein product [Rotaria sp. Silwood2]|nr:unnamed protein product [Rotaria sp. Silwood2]
MEGCLAVPSKYPWTTVFRHEILSTICLMLNTLTVAMRFEPGNARLFENEVPRCFHDIALDCVDKSLINPVSKNEPVKSGTSIDNTEESVSSPLFRIGTFSMPTTTRTSATFTFPSYMEKPIIVYPGAIVCFLQIIACIPRMIDEQIRTKT